MSTFPMLLPKYDGPEITKTYSSAYEQSVIRWTNAAFDEAEYDQQQVEELSLVQTYIDYLESKQWTTARPASKSKPVNNLMVGLFWEIISQLTDIRPVIEIRSSQGDESDLATKRACSVLNMGLRGWSLDTDFDLKLASCIAYSVLTTAFAKFQWNPFLNFGQGEIEMVPLGPDKVLPLKSAGDLESSEAVIFKDVWSLRKFRQVYPTNGSLVAPDDRFSNYQIMPQAPPNVPPMIFKLMSDGMKRQLTGGMRTASSAVPMAQLREFWLRDETPQ